MRLIAVMTFGLLVTTGCATTTELDRASERADRAEALMTQWQQRAREREAQLRQLQHQLNGVQERLARALTDCRRGSSSGSPRPPASKDEKAIENCVAVMRRLNPDGGSAHDWWRACRGSDVAR